MKCVQTGVGEARSRQSFPVEYHNPSVDDCLTVGTSPSVLNGKDASGRGQRDCICPNWPQLKHLTLE